MGNALDMIMPVEKNPTKKITMEDLKWKRYVTVYKEGSEKLPEDPKFPKKLYDESIDWSYDNKNNYGTYVYYPGEKRVKMWVSSYRCLNPEDFLCPNSIPQVLHDLSDTCPLPTYGLEKTVMNSLNCVDSALAGNCNEHDEPLYDGFKDSNHSPKNIKATAQSNLTIHPSRVTSSELREETKRARSKLRETAKIATGTQYNSQNWSNKLKEAKRRAFR